MRKFLCVFLFCSLLGVSTYSQFQSVCNKQAPKISYSGKAPWAIDGKITDWAILLGPSPFINPPPASAFNWVNDNFLIPGSLPPKPKPQNDIQFMAFTHDDYNVYYYMRRGLNGSSTNSLYYFMDVNGDAVMNLGEPVIHASFTNKSISALTLGLFLPDRDTGYSEQRKGNWLGFGAFGGPNAQSVVGYSMPGDVLDIINSQTLFFPFNLKKNEIFSARLTEDGYGFEMAIPWRYLKNWLDLKRPLNPGDIFFYKVSMKEGGGHYSQAKVVDDAGSCRGGPGISGSPELAKTITTTTLVPGSAYRFNLTYNNLTNAATELGLEHIDLNFASNPALPLMFKDFNITVYNDINCNGQVDANEKPFNYLSPPFGNDSCCHYVFYNGAVSGLTPPGVSLVLPPSGKGCFIIDLTLAPGKVLNKFKISFSTSVFFVEGREPCEPSCGSKPINPVGFIESEVGSDLFSSGVQRRSVDAPVNRNVMLYPNPGRGISNLILPRNADVTVVDNMGRNVQTLNNAKAGILQLKNLKPGFYIVKVRILETGEMITKKLVIQH